MRTRFNELLESKLGNVKPLITEQASFDLSSAINNYDLTKLLTDLGFQQGFNYIESNLPRFKNNLVDFTKKRNIPDSDIFTMSGNLVVLKDSRAKVYYISGLPKMKYQFALNQDQVSKMSTTIKGDVGGEMKLKGYSSQTLKYMILMGTIGEEKLKGDFYSPLIGKLLIDKGYIDGPKISSYQSQNPTLYRLINSVLSKNRIWDMNNVYLGMEKNTVITIIKKTDRGYEVVKDDYQLISDKVPYTFTASQLYKKLSPSY